MSIIYPYLKTITTPEQFAMLESAASTVVEYGYAELEMTLDELFMISETLSSEDIQQKVFSLILQAQRFILNVFNLSLDTDDIAIINDFIMAIRSLEDSEEHAKITSVIDSAETPYDALILLLTEVVYCDITDIEPCLLNVSVETIEKIQDIHYKSLTTENDGETLKPLDPRILEIVKEFWEVKRLNHIKNHIIVNELNLPINRNKAVQLSEIRNTDLSFKPNLEEVPGRLLEIVCVSTLNYDTIMSDVRTLAKQLFSKDVKGLTELMYLINSMSVRLKMNG